MVMRLVQDKVLLLEIQQEIISHGLDGLHHNQILKVNLREFMS